MNPPKFHEIQWISKDQLPGMVTPMFSLLLLLFVCFFGCLFLWQASQSLVWEQRIAFSGATVLLFWILSTFLDFHGDG